VQAILKTMNLTKIYNDKPAVENINMNINQGDIYGLIGENGAGKTTIFKIITGIASKTSGVLELFGESTEDNLHVERKRIGALIEKPFLYANMTLSENLEACRIQKGIPGKNCIKEVLQLFRLNYIKDKKVHDLSLGMRQKLGIAMAVIGDPEFLVLDEPINGIDPLAIMEVRNILLDLNKNRNVTILVSSHILKELYNFATCYGIIHNGKLLNEFTLKELNEKLNKSLRIEVDDVNKAVFVLETKLHTHNFKILPDGTVILYDYVDNPGKVSSLIFREGVTILGLVTESGDLENYFKDVIEGVSEDV